MNQQNQTVYRKQAFEHKEFEFSVLMLYASYSKGPFVSPFRVSRLRFMHIYLNTRYSCRVSASGRREKRAILGLGGDLLGLELR